MLKIYIYYIYYYFKLFLFCHWMARMMRVFLKINNYFNYGWVKLFIMRAFFAIPKHQITNIKQPLNRRL